MTTKSVVISAAMIAAARSIFYHVSGEHQAVTGRFCLLDNFMLDRAR